MWVDFKDGEKLYFKISNCRKCSTNYRPFMPSKIEPKKVAVISLKPSYQAFTRPMASIRFYKALLSSLLGKNPLIGDYQNVSEFFLDNFYWSHYYKW